MNKKNKKTTSISISIEIELLELIKDQAKKENRSLSNYIAYKLKQK